MQFHSLICLVVVVVAILAAVPGYGSPFPEATPAPINYPPPSFEVAHQARDRYDLQRRTPYFPDDPPSCQICQQGYSDIDSCASAASVFDNYAQIIFNPGAFVDVIRCSCTDTFKAVFPQCVDCFIQTNQTQFLTEPADKMPSILNGMRQICALASTLFGGVASTNSQLVGQTPITVPTATGAALRTADLRAHSWFDLQTVLPMGAVILSVVVALTGGFMAGL